MWKTLSVFAALLTAGAAFLSFLNKNDVELERELLAASKQNLESIETRLKEVKAEQAVMVRRKEAMDERLVVALEEQEKAKEELQAKNDEIKEVDDRNVELEAEIANAKEKISEFGNIEQLVALIDQLQADLFTAKNEIATLETRLASTTTRENNTAQTIQNFKDLEYRQRNGEMVSINANIASVYNTWGFAVLDAGDRDGVVSRTKLDVKRGGEKIAELIVTNLEKDRSVCDIVPGSMEPGQMIRPGDKVSVSPESLPKPKAETTPTTPTIPGLPVTPGTAPAPMDPAPTGVPAGEDDPFAELGGDASPPATSTEEATPGDDPFSGL